MECLVCGPGVRGPPQGNLKFWIDSSLIITIWWFCPKLKSNYKTIYLHKIVISNRNLFGIDLKINFLFIWLSFANKIIPSFIFQVCSVIKLEALVVQNFLEYSQRELDLIQWPLRSSIYFGRKIGRNRFQVYENHKLYYKPRKKPTYIEAVNLAK